VDGLTRLGTILIAGLPLWFVTRHGFTFRRSDGIRIELVDTAISALLVGEEGAV
jgi:hypothetical protein